jgi:hypothetical protein
MAINLSRGLTTQWYTVVETLLSQRVKEGFLSASVYFDNCRNFD